MKLKDLKFYEASEKDREKLKKLLLKVFPNTASMCPQYKRNIKITDGDVIIEQSVHNWLLTLADEFYKWDDIFNLYYWQGNNPVDDLMDSIEEDIEEKELKFDKVKGLIHI